MSGLTDDQRRSLLDRGDRRFDAYYYSFEPTGCEPVDLILMAVARAGKLAHHTDTWQNDQYHWSHYGGTPADLIQAAAESAAASWKEVRS